VLGFRKRTSLVRIFVKLNMLRDGAGDGVEGALPNALSGEPVVFNELADGTLVGDGVVDEILLCPWRDDK
jgi:hypothetical protein